jgi:hypothetical protein
MRLVSSHREQEAAEQVLQLLLNTALEPPHSFLSTAYEIARQSPPALQHEFCVATWVAIEDVLKAQAMGKPRAVVASLNQRAISFARKWRDQLP